MSNKNDWTDRLPELLEGYTEAEPEGEEGESPVPAALEVRRKLAEEPEDPKDAAADAFASAAASCCA